MKNLRYWILPAALILLTAVWFTACSEKGDVNNPNPINQSVQTSLDSPQFALIDYADVQNGLEDATLSTDMGFNSVLINGSFLNMTTMQDTRMMNSNLWLRQYDHAKLIGLAFKLMNITDDQKVKILGFMKTFHDTMKTLIKEYAAANDSILIAASAKRKLIAADFKNGKITGRQADSLIKALNLNTRKAVDSNPKSVVLKGSMCSARALLFLNVEGILTPPSLLSGMLINFL